MTFLIIKGSKNRLNAPKTFFRMDIERYGVLITLKYIQQMKTEGIIIDAITIQNEPLHPGNNPSMYMPAEAQRDFIKNNRFKS